VQVYPAGSRQGDTEKCAAASAAGAAGAASSSALRDYTLLPYYTAVIALGLIDVPAHEDQENLLDYKVKKVINQKKDKSLIIYRQHTAPSSRYVQDYGDYGAYGVYVPV
jgi:hypothetical protein